MTPSLTIRRASLADVYAMWRIEKGSFPSPWTLWCFFSELANPASTTLVAGPAAPRSWQVWGYVVFWVVAEEMHIMNLAVHPEHRRQGIARALLKKALTQARAAGAAVAWLEVRPSNDAALALYHSFGFAQIGVRPRYYIDNQEDALILSFSWENN